MRLTMTFVLFCFNGVFSSLVFSEGFEIQNTKCPLRTYNRKSKKWEEKTDLTLAPKSAVTILRRSKTNSDLVLLSQAKNLDYYFEASEKCLTTATDSEFEPSLNPAGVESDINYHVLMAGYGALIEPLSFETTSQEVEDLVNLGNALMLGYSYEGKIWRAYGFNFNLKTFLGLSKISNDGAAESFTYNSTSTFFLSSTLGLGLTIRLLRDSQTLQTRLGISPQVDFGFRFQNLGQPTTGTLSSKNFRLVNAIGIRLYSHLGSNFWLTQSASVVNFKLGDFLLVTTFGFDI